MDTQERIYAEMNYRNASLHPQLYNTLTESTDCCIAAWSGGFWRLMPAYQRLIERLRYTAGDYLTFYWPQDAASENDGILHQTLLQIVGFNTFNTLHKNTIPVIMNGAAEIIRKYPLPLTVEYRGLVWTATGLALAGYTQDYLPLLELRERLGSLYGAAVPYKNDIVHATCARWKAQPPADVLFALRQEVMRWSEATFGTIQISSWTIGTCTLLMRPSDRYDFTTVKCPLHILHRGNSLNNPAVENSPEKLLELVRTNHHVELDIWSRSGKLFLGHDGPEIEVSYDWLLNVISRALIHCKDGRTFRDLRTWFAERAIAANLFYHTTEDYALSTNDWVITYPGKTTFRGFLSMMPESASKDPLAEDCFAVCSDKLLATSAAASGR